MQTMLSDVTTEIIQQYLDENKQLIFAILHNRNLAKEAECIELQARLQRNLQYLATIADNQVQLQATSQQPPSAAALAAPQYVPCQQPQKTVPQPLMASPPLMLFAQQQQQQQQQKEQQKMALYSQLMPSSGVNSEFSVPNGDGGHGRRLAGGTEPRVYLKGREAERN